MHTAGFLGVQAVAEHPLLTMDVNILGTRNCLEFALGQDRMQRIVTFSTSEVFGTFANKATEGDMAMIPTDGDRWCYSTSKLASEQYTRAYGRDHDMPYTIVRPFNVYGPHRFGSNAVSRFTEAAVAGDRITVQGDGSQRRAWCHVDDFVGGVLAAMTQPGGLNEDFNIGNPAAGLLGAGTGRDGGRARRLVVGDRGHRQRDRRHRGALAQRRQAGGQRWLRSFDRPSLGAHRHHRLAAGRAGLIRRPGIFGTGRGCGPWQARRDAVPAACVGYRTFRERAGGRPGAVRPPCCGARRKRNSSRAQPVPGR